MRYQRRPGLVLAALLLGLTVKTPTFPFRTWLPRGHSDAPAIGSAVPAGVMVLRDIEGRVLRDFG